MNIVEITVWERDVMKWVGIRALAYVWLCKEHEKVFVVKSLNDGQIPRKLAWTEEMKHCSVIECSKKPSAVYAVGIEI